MGPALTKSQNPKRAQKLNDNTDILIRHNPNRQLVSLTITIVHAKYLSQQLSISDEESKKQHIVVLST